MSDTRRLVVATSLSGSAVSFSLTKTEVKPKKWSQQGWRGSLRSGEVRSRWLLGGPVGCHMGVVWDLDYEGQVGEWVGEISPSPKMLKYSFVTLWQR